MSSVRTPHLLAEQAPQHPKLPAAAVNAIRLAAGVVVADVDKHQLQDAHLRHTYTCLNVLRLSHGVALTHVIALTLSVHIEQLAACVLNALKNSGTMLMHHSTGHHHSPDAA
jgi:hypothetical protein